MTRLALAGGIVLAAALVAWVVSRRQPSSAGAGLYPSWVDAAAVGVPSGGVVVFSEPGCRSCEGVVEQVRGSGQPHAVVSTPEGRARFGVRDVPTTVVVAADGTVSRGWLGPLPPGAP